METEADVKKALALNGATLGTNALEVTLPIGLQTCKLTLTLLKQGTAANKSLFPPSPLPSLNQPRAVKNLHLIHNRETLHHLEEKVASIYLVYFHMFERASNKGRFSQKTKQGEVA